MIVCSCNVLSEGQVRACLNPGADCPRTAAQVYQCLGCSPKCGRCARTIRSIVANALGEAHACSTSCAVACPMSKAADHVHSASHDRSASHVHSSSHVHSASHDHHAHAAESIAEHAILATV